jgi:hypothetical protein
MDAPKMPLTHRRCTIIGHIPKKLLKGHQINAVVDSHIGRLPIKNNDITDTFRRQLAWAYERDYSKLPIVDFGKVPIQWASKFAFSG